MRSPLIRCGNQLTHTHQLITRGDIKVFMPPIGKDDAKKCTFFTGRQADMRDRGPDRLYLW
jgi:hypothetical protein